MSNYLSNQNVHDLTNALLSSGLTTADARDELLTGINLGYIATLPLRSNMLDQIRSDLVQMNTVPYLIGNEVPLKIWLENAVQRLRRGFRPEVLLFQNMLNEVATKSQNVLNSTGGRGDFEKTSGPERIIHQDDLLSYDWLKGAVTVGTSVARLIVPRYEHGQQIHYPGTNRPMMYMGTGWLIGAKHIITNHHVINARSESESNATESDLRLQALHTRVQFDYDSEGLEGVIEPIDSLVAWVERDATPILDFAILELKTCSSRKPLTLAPQSVHLLGNSVQPVNVIQHPQGNPKSLGVRNNLFSALDDFALRYYTDTMAGSSGSPVCNDKWQVLGLHRAWEYVHKDLNFQGKPTAWINVGVRIDRIVEYLNTNMPSLWATIGATVVS